MRMVLNIQVGVTELGLVVMSAIYAAVHLGHRIIRVPVGCLGRGFCPKSNCCIGFANCSRPRHGHPGPLTVEDAEKAVKELLRKDGSLTGRDLREVRISLV